MSRSNPLEFPPPPFPCVGRFAPLRPPKPPFYALSVFTQQFTLTLPRSDACKDALTPVPWASPPPFPTFFDFKSCALVHRDLLFPPLQLS